MRDLSLTRYYRILAFRALHACVVIFLVEAHIHDLSLVHCRVDTMTAQPDLWFGWRYQMPALADAGYRVIAIDNRGELGCLVSTRIMSNAFFAHRQWFGGA